MPQITDKAAYFSENKHLWKAYTDWHKPDLELYLTNESTDIDTINSIETTRIRNSSSSLNFPLDKTQLFTRSLAFTAKGLSSFILAFSISNSHADTTPQSKTTDEYAVKADYIYNILRFVSWAETSPLSHTDTLNVCLIEPDTFSKHLDPVRKKTIGSKPITIKRISDTSGSYLCHLLFVEDNDTYENFKKNHQLKHIDTILLGNDIEFVRLGGLFGFYMDNDKVRLGANRKAIINSGLNISSLLIEVCQLHGDER